MKYQIILASGSPRRKELLELIGVEFKIITSNKEEVITSTNPEEVVKELSMMKAEDVAEGVLGPAIILGADIALTNYESNSRYQSLIEQTEGGITLEKCGFDVTLFVETREINDANSLINAIQEANQNNSQPVKVKLMANIIFESEAQNTMYQNLPSNFVIDYNEYTVTLFEV